MHHKVGIWIDHKKAVIVSTSADRVTGTTVESRPAERRRRGHRKGTNGNVLNLLARKFKKRFLAQQCKELTTCLADAITATMEAAPVRVGKRYIHHRETSRATRASEATWEEALFRQWKTPPGRTFAPWKRLLTHHVPLQDSKHDEDWGAIDLLGASNDNLPVVVELKAPRSNQSPAEMLVQATAYAVAVKKAWPQCLRSEWASALKVEADTLPGELNGCELVCAAPSEYWENWTGNTPRGRTIGADAWAAIAELRKSLEKSGYPSTFLRLEHDGTAASPKSIRPVEEHLPTG
jgi:hypothetical protein